MTDVPLVPTAFRGYRTWRALPQDQALRSMSRDIYWMTDELRAECLTSVAWPGRFSENPIQHSAPDERCTCGIYAVTNPIDQQICATAGLLPLVLLSSLQGIHANIPPQLTPVLGLDFGPIGAVEGTGRVYLPHTDRRGFRAQSMRILALAYCVPDELFIDRNVIDAYVAWDAISITYLHHGQRYRKRVFVDPRSVYGSVDPRSINAAIHTLDRRIREQHPQVPIFDDLNEMVKNFPPPDYSSLVSGVREVNP